MAFGRTCRQSTRQCDTPSARAASTNGRARTPSTSPRTMRATPIQPGGAEHDEHRDDSPGRHSATQTSSSTRRGIASSASAHGHRDAIGHAAAPGGQRAGQRADRRRQQGAADADRERDARGEHHAHEEVAAETIGAEQVPGAAGVAAERREQAEREHVADGERVLLREQRHDERGGEHDQERGRGAASDAVRRVRAVHGARARGADRAAAARRRPRSSRRSPRRRRTP